jgi:hypothetical protein
MTDSTTAVEAAPFVALAEPYFAAIASTAVPVLIGIAVNAFARWTGVKIDAAYQAKIEAAAATEAGKAVAAAADNLSSRQIDVGSKVVADAADKIMDAPHLQEAIAATGATPERIAAIVAGEIGKLQATMTSTSPAAKPSAAP